MLKNILKIALITSFSSCMDLGHDRKTPIYYNKLLQSNKLQTNFYLENRIKLSILK